MSSQKASDAKANPSSSVLRYDSKVPRLELKTDIAGLSVAEMHELDNQNKLSRPAKPEAEPEPEDVPENKPQTSEEVYSGSGPVMSHNPPPPRPLVPRSVLFQRHQEYLDRQYARKSRKEKPRIVKCSDLKIRIG